MLSLPNKTLPPPNSKLLYPINLIYSKDKQFSDSRPWNKNLPYHLIIDNFPFAYHSCRNRDKGMSDLIGTTVYWKIHTQENVYRYHSELR